LRASHPSLIATGRTLAELREPLVRDWADWLGERLSPSTTVSRPVLERELRLIIDVLAGMVGPLRREARELWARACEHYGRTAAARGLAAGEVVEEMQFLRELLIRNLAGTLAPMRARQAMAIMLRLNQVLDRGIAVAVAGYTDALVAQLFAHDGVPSADNALDAGEVERQVGEIERQLGALAERA
jgi:hypothetical protein